MRLYQWVILKDPLHRVVDAAGNFGDLIHRLYTTPQYVPVSRKEFKGVEIIYETAPGVQCHLSSVKSSQHYIFVEAGIPTSYHHEETVLLRC